MLQFLVTSSYSTTTTTTTAIHLYFINKAFSDYIGRTAPFFKSNLWGRAGKIKL